MPETAVAPAPTLEEKFQKLESAATTTVESPTTQEKPAEVVPAGGQPEVVKTEGEPTTAETQPEPEEEPDLEHASEASGDFEKFKEVFDAHPTLKGELKQILGREKAFTEMQGEQSFSEFKQIHERVPTLQDAERLVEESEQAREFGRTYREDPIKFVSGLKQSDPHAFTKLVSDLPGILAKTDLNAWREQAATYIDPVLNNLYGIASRDKNEALAQAVQLVAQSLGIAPGSRTSPASNPEVEELRKKLQEKEQSEGTQAFESFWGQTDSTVIERTVTEIEGTLKKAAPNASPAQLKRMVKEVYDGTLSALGSQPQFVAQMESYRESAKKGKQGISDHNAIVDFATKRAKLVIPRVARDVASEWNKSILQTSKQTTEKKQAIAATTKDVGAGPQATSSAAAAVPKNGKRTANDVWSELESGNYVKPAARV